MTVSHVSKPTINECHSGAQAKGDLPHLLVNAAHTAFFSIVAAALKVTLQFDPGLPAQGTILAGNMTATEKAHDHACGCPGTLGKTLPKRNSEEGDESHLVVALKLLLLSVITPEAVGTGCGACQWRHSGP